MTRGDADSVASFARIVLPFLDAQMGAIVPLIRPIANIKIQENNMLWSIVVGLGVFVSGGA